MRETKLSEAENLVANEIAFPSMDVNVEHWLQREIQLNQLHEEILAGREASLLARERHARDSENLVLTEVPVEIKSRNKTLLEDIATAQSKLSADGNRAVSPRFSTLQNNYWVMVKNVSPVWEEELLDYKQKQRGRLQHQQQQRSPLAQHRSPQTLHPSAALRQTSPSLQRRSPKFHRRSPKSQRKITGRQETS